MCGCHQSVGSGLIDHFSEETSGVQIGSGTQNHRPRMIRGAGDCLYTADSMIFHNQLADLALANGQMIRILQRPTHTGAISSLVRLGTQRVYCRSFGAVQHLGLNKGMVNIHSHFSAQGIDFTHQMPFGAAADIRVAGHHGNRFHAYGKQYGLQSQSGAGQCRFTAGMTGSHHHHIIIFF